MTDESITQQLRDAGASAIKRDGVHDQTMIPLEQEGVVFRQMFEYPVADFEAEVGFYASVLGLPTIALTGDYALFAHPDGDYCFSFRKDLDLPSPGTIGLKLLFMTSNIDSADTHLEQTGRVHDRETREGSPVQRVIHFSSPAGIAIEIWEDPSPGNNDR